MFEPFIPVSAHLATPRKAVMRPCITYTMPLSPLLDGHLEFNRGGLARALANSRDCHGVRGSGAEITLIAVAGIGQRRRRTGVQIWRGDLYAFTRGITVGLEGDGAVADFRDQAVRHHDIGRGRGARAVRYADGVFDDGAGDGLRVAGAAGGGAGDGGGFAHGQRRGGDLVVGEVRMRLVVRGIAGRRAGGVGEYVLHRAGDVGRTAVVRERGAVAGLGRGLQMIRGDVTVAETGGEARDHEHRDRRSGGEVDDGGAGVRSRVIAVFADGIGEYGRCRRGVYDVRAGKLRGRARQGHGGKIEVQGVVAGVGDGESQYVAG